MKHSQKLFEGHRAEHVPEYIQPLIDILIFSEATIFPRKPIQIRMSYHHEHFTPRQLYVPCKDLRRIILGEPDIQKGFSHLPV